VVLLWAFFAPLFFMLCAAPLQAAKRITPIHGSFSNESRWFRPGGAFYEAVKKSLDDEEAEIKPFIWSGGISPLSIIEGAAGLVEHLLTFPPHDSVFILAHSNGGNVTAYATMMLAALNQISSTNSTVKLEDIPETLKRPFAEKKLTKSRLPAQNELSPEVEQALHASLLKLQSTMARSHYLKRALPSYQIELVCLMGTPINTNVFDIDMNVVRQVINLYSVADVIQPLVGSQTLPAHSRRANVQVKLHHDQNAPAPIDPCHKNIRHAIIGGWLLQLPELLANNESPEEINALQSGCITFYENKRPVFTPGLFDQNTGNQLQALYENMCNQETDSSSSLSEEDESIDWLSGEA